MRLSHHLGYDGFTAMVGWIKELKDAAMQRIVRF